jgi:hypothetical protein
MILKIDIKAITSLNSNHYHHMALQPNSGPDLPLWGFVKITFYEAELLVQRPTPNLEDQASVFMTPQRQGGPAMPPGTGHPF